MIRSKECFKCKTVKPLDEFYKHSKMVDGHLNKCKECTKSDVNKHRSENLEKVRAYDRERGKLAHRIALRTEVNRAWREEDRRRQHAHSKVRQAIHNGTITRMPCIRCGNEKSLAHHEDYDKPVDVMWLCQPCHKQRHKEMLLSNDREG
jgi:ribosomal protein S27AE